MNLDWQSIFVHTSKVIITCLKILRHGLSGFTFPPKKVVLRICIAFKNPLPQSGLNPRTLGPLGSTLTNHTTETIRQLIRLNS
jgi:hypothetical protein